MEALLELRENLLGVSGNLRRFNLAELRQLVFKVKGRVFAADDLITFAAGLSLAARQRGNLDTDGKRGFGINLDFIEGVGHCLVRTGHECGNRSATAETAGFLHCQVMVESLPGRGFDKHDGRHDGLDLFFREALL